MSACEKCWADAGGVYARYLELLEERKDNPCKPVMPMLPNDYDPGARCSCAECLERFK